MHGLLFEISFLVLSAGGWVASGIMAFKKNGSLSKNKKLILFIGIPTVFWISNAFALIGNPLFNAGIMTGFYIGSWIYTGSLVYWLTKRR